MIDHDDYTQDVRTVVRAEAGPLSGERLYDEAEDYYRENGRLLYAHLKAARLLQERGIPVSARFLTEFARWATKLGYLMPYLFDIYDAVPVKERDGLKIPNATSAWLTRWLEEQGVRVRKSRSKMDDVEEADE